MTGCAAPKSRNRTVPRRNFYCHPLKQIPQTPRSGPAGESARRSAGTSLHPVTDPLWKDVFQKKNPGHGLAARRPERTHPTSPLDRGQRLQDDATRDATHNPLKRRLKNSISRLPFLFPLLLLFFDHRPKLYNYWVTPVLLCPAGFYTPQDMCARTCPLIATAVRPPK